MQRAINVIASFKDMPYCQSFIHKVKLISCERQVAHLELQLEKPHCNTNSTLHGGMATTLIDVYTCALLKTAYEENVLFSTTELKARFLRPAKLGDTILMEARIIRAGRRVAFAEMDILDKTTQKILVQGTQTALVVPVN
ncbi:acyl-coenzyme A thioesterase 13-like [Dermacentor albipictus]|uniref:acyl-coenzyme A thioesterase 13-like n=1 Tax=Dermacentor albipictus TaxID=60249 RepID=UPI0038FC2771